MIDSRYLQFDTRFVTEKVHRITYLLHWITMIYSTDDLKKMMLCAEKLGIADEMSDWCTKPAVDILYFIAQKLSVLDAEIVSPHLIMERINSYLEAN